MQCRALLLVEIVICLGDHEFDDGAVRHRGRDVENEPASADLRLERLHDN